MSRPISILLFLVAMSIVSCGEPGEGSGGREVAAGPIGGPGTPPGGGGTPLPPVSSATDSIIGVWQITETSKTANDPNCQPPTNPLATYSMYVVQNGTAAVAEMGSDLTTPFQGVDSEGPVVTGTFSGTSLSLTGTNIAGTRSTTTSTTATVAAGCNTLTGTQTFTLTDTALSCSGTIQLTGTRLLGNGCAVVNVGSVTETEPNNTALTAQVITLPAHVTGTITENTDTDDWYSFSVSGSTPVTVVLNGPLQDIDLHLYDTAGTTLLASSVSVTARDAFGITLAAGTYKVRVFRFNVTGTATYELFVQ